MSRGHSLVRALQGMRTHAMSACMRAAVAKVRLGSFKENMGKLTARQLDALGTKQIIGHTGYSGRDKTLLRSGKKPSKILDQYWKWNNIADQPSRHEGGAGEKNERRGRKGGAPGPRTEAEPARKPPKAQPATPER